MQMKLKKNLTQFLYDTTQAGYGNPNIKSEKASDGANVITHQVGEWRMVDLFYGGHPYAGQEVIYYQGKALWAMQYRGWLHDTSMTPGEVYTFLKRALLAAPADHPYRGPHELQEDKLSYQNHWQGDIDNFFGEEVILADGQEIYKAAYFGGLIDQPPTKASEASDGMMI